MGLSSCGENTTPPSHEITIQSAAIRGVRKRFHKNTLDPNISRK